MDSEHPGLLLTVAHPCGVALNRRLALEMAPAGGEEWDVTAVAPRFFHGDLRPIALEPQPSELCRLVAVNAHLSRSSHPFFYGIGLGDVLRERWNLVYCREELYIIADGQVTRCCSRRILLAFFTA